MILADKGGTKGWVDIHAHILPGVDDGASDWEETGEMLCKAYKQGITRIIATPHYVSGQDTKRLREMMKRLKETAFSISENMMGTGKGADSCRQQVCAGGVPAGRRIYAAVQGGPPAGSVILPASHRPCGAV